MRSIKDQAEYKTKNIKKTYKILLIESNEEDSFLFQKTLSKLTNKLEISTINSGNSAIDFLNNLQSFDLSPRPMPDLIILNNQLSDINGLEILKEIKRKAYLLEIPVIFLSTNNSDEECIKAYSLQASSFIRKSLNYEDFQKQIKALIHYWTEVVQLPRTSATII